MFKLKEWTRSEEGADPHNGEVVEGYDEWQKKWVEVTYYDQSRRFFDKSSVFPFDRMNKWRRKNE